MFIDSIHFDAHPVLLGVAAAHFRNLYMLVSTMKFVELDATLSNDASCRLRELEYLIYLALGI